MLLAIDVGNSNVTIGVWEGERWKQVWRLPTLSDSDEESLLFYNVKISDLLLEYRVSPDTVHQIVISTVVPGLKEVFVSLTEQFFGRMPIVLGPEIYAALPLQVVNPNELGSDLYANALAAYHRYKKGVIVTDFGTALTFTVVNSEGALTGVTIAPGIKTAITSLFQKTAQLPEVPLEMPRSVLGKDTVHAIQSGVLNGYVGMVRHMIGSLREEVGSPYVAVATGGLSHVLKPLHSAFHEIDANLTLDGLRLVAEEYRAF